MLAPLSGDRWWMNDGCVYPIFLLLDCGRVVHFPVLSDRYTMGIHCCIRWRVHLGVLHHQRNDILTVCYCIYNEPHGAQNRKPDSHSRVAAII